MDHAPSYRKAYEEQLRARVAPGEQLDRSGPVVRRAQSGRGYVLYRDLDGLDGERLDAFIADQRAHFTGRVAEVEWKHHDGDLPADLPDRLAAAGFEPRARETVMVGETASLPPIEPPAGVRLRQVTDREDLERVGDLEEAVWGWDHGWLVDMLQRSVDGPGDPVAVIVAEAADEVVCAAWARFHEGTEFASLWGGSTLPSWRRRGVYSAVVARRARLAAEHGFGFVQVDASAASRPVLAQIGLLPVATTTPYVWRVSRPAPTPARR